MGQSQSMCKSERSAIASASFGGTIQKGILSAISYDAACGVLTK